MCVCVCVCVCVCPFVCQWTKFQSNGCTDLDAVFAKWLLTALAWTILGQRSMSQWRNIHFFFIILRLLGMFFFSFCLFVCFYTSTKSWRGYIFTAVCLCVCLSVCVSGSSCEQNSSRTDESIWTRFSLNGCLPHWLEPYWNWWPWIKGQGHLLHNSLLTSLLYISALLRSIKMKFNRSLRYTLGRFVFKFYKNRMGDDVIMTPFKFSPNNCPYQKFYWTYKLHTWIQYTTT